MVNLSQYVQSRMGELEMDAVEETVRSIDRAAVAHQVHRRKGRRRENGEERLRLAQSFPTIEELMGRMEERYRIVLQAARIAQFEAYPLLRTAPHEIAKRPLPALAELCGFEEEHPDLRGAGILEWVLLQHHRARGIPRPFSWGSRRGNGPSRAPAGYRGREPFDPEYREWLRRILNDTGVTDALFEIGRTEALAKQLILVHREVRCATRTLLVPHLGLVSADPHDYMNGGHRQDSFHALHQDAPPVHSDALPRLHMAAADLWHYLQSDVRHCVAVRRHQGYLDHDQRRRLLRYLRVVVPVLRRIFPSGDPVFDPDGLLPRDPDRRYASMYDVSTAMLDLIEGYLPEEPL